MAIGADTIWRVRAGGNNVNGGGYDATVSGATTDYSQQDAAQLSGSLGTAAGTTTFSDAGVSFPAVPQGNFIYIASGTGFTPGAYCVISRTNATTVVLDRSPGTGSAAVWKLGGAFADPWTRFTAGSSPAVPGNYAYIRGAGSQYPTVDDYARTGGIALVQGTSSGVIRFIGENGCPRIASDGLLYSSIVAVRFDGIYFSANGTNNGGEVLVAARDGYTSCISNCTLDRNGEDVTMVSNGGWLIIQSEVVDTQAGSGTKPALSVASFGNVTAFCNIHDVPANGVTCFDQQLGTHFYGNIFTRCGGWAISSPGVPDDREGTGNSIWGNTFDDNGEGAITLDTAGQPLIWTIGNNLFTNHTTGAGTGIASVGTTADNDRLKAWTDWNAFYNNTLDVEDFTLDFQNMVNNITGVNPGYQAQATQGYKPGPALKSAGYPGAVFPNSKSGTTATRSYVTPGAVQRIVPAEVTARAPKPVMLVY